MILELANQPIPATGRYEFGCGGALPQEAAAIAAFLRAFSLHIPLELALHPQLPPGVPWIGNWPASSASPVEADASVLTLFTSGTTGEAKPIIRHKFADFFQRKKGLGGPDDIWVLAYQPFRWAGITLLSHCLKNGCRLAVPQSLQLTDVMAAASEATHVSLTPTLFRKILVEVPRQGFSDLRLKQVTFGGEPVSQKVLDDARELFPDARITHTYASTEFGDICSTSDARAGFPEDKFREFEWAVDGELLIGGRPTGDCWRKENGRFYFVSRKEDIVNVGGNKVSLSMVEQVAVGLPGVYHAIARVTPSALMGSVISLEYVGELAPREVLRWLRTKLPKYACPAMVTPCAEILTAQTGKALR